MNFYLDFEATQFAQRIISIGCVTETGDSFYTLVKPVDGDKINAFITNLTGISAAMIEEKGLAPEEALKKLRYFIQTHQDSEEPSFFYTYGCSDKDFLNHTIKHCDDFDFNEKNWFYSLAASFIDYTTFVNRFFKTKTISLKKAAAWFKGEEIIQKHNALEDADILRFVACGIASTEPPELNPWAAEMEEQARKQRENNAKMSIFAKQKKYTIIAVGKTKLEFKSLASAAAYIHDILLDKNQRKITKGKNIEQKIKKAIKTKQLYFGYTWEIKEEEVKNNE